MALIMFYPSALMSILKDLVFPILLKQTLYDNKTP